MDSHYDGFGGSQMAQEALGDTQEQGQTHERVRSTVQFPYLALEDAISVAKGVHETGGNSCQVDQLAAHLKLPADASMFRVKMGAARMFGLTSSSQGIVSLTALGIRICDPTQEQAAKAEAFLTVPLYKQVYEQFKGGNLPPASALETAIANMGVAPKQKSTARQVFQRSAAQAGFFAYGPSRLVYPTIKGSTTGSVGDVQTAPTDLEKPPEKPKNGGTDSGGGGGRHQLIIGLIETLPPEKTEWPTDERKDWLEAAATIFNLIYKSADKNSLVIEVREK